MIFYIFKSNISKHCSGLLVCFSRSWDGYKDFCKLMTNHTDFFFFQKKWRCLWESGSKGKERCQKAEIGGKEEWICQETIKITWKDEI